MSTSPPPPVANFLRGAIEYEKLDKEAFLEFAEKWGYKVNVCDTAEDEDD